MPTERDIFERLFVNRGPMRPAEFAREIMLLGLVAYYKWDYALSRKAENPKRAPTSEELDQFQITEQRVHDIESLVKSALREHAESRRVTPGFWYGVWQSATGAFVYSLLVAAVVFALVFSNVSIPTLLGIDIERAPVRPTEDDGREANG